MAAPTGHVVTATAGNEYHVARKLLNERLDFRPEEIVYCYGEADVVNAVRYALANGFQVGVRSGGHDYEGFSLNDGGLVIDTSRCDQFSVNAERGTAIVGPGTPLRTLYHRLGGTRLYAGDPGYTLPGGSCGTVAVGGLVTGGGFGLLSRKYGMFCDKLVRVRLVDGTGTAREATADDDPDDLLWATRGGGGGNFGVVTECEFELVKAVPAVTSFGFTWPAHDDLVRTIVRRFTGWEPSNEMFANVIVHAAGDTGSQVSFGGQSFGSQAQTLAEIAPVVGGDDPLPPPLSASVSPLQTLSLLDAADAGGGDDFEHHNWKMASSLGRGRLSERGLDAVVDALHAGPTSDCYVQFDTFGGAINDVAADATAFVHRDMTYTVQYQAYWTDPAVSEISQAWLRDAFETIDEQIGTRASYRNYCDLNLLDWEDRYYKDNYPRLREAKSRFDPHNLFHYPQSIVPAARPPER